MTLKSKLYIFMSILFVIFSTLVWVYSSFLFENINEEWTKRFVKKQIIFDKNRTLLPIMHEETIVKEMAHEPAVIAMAQDDMNETRKANGLAVLEKYRLKLQNRTYFAAFTKSENYYFNDNKGSYKGKEFQYKLSALTSNDSWFYTTIADDRLFQVNVDVDEKLGNTKVWINYLLKDNGKTIGVVGTGFDFNQFIEESVGIEQDGVRNFLIDSKLLIQLARDTKLVDYASLTQSDGEHKSIGRLFPKDINAIESAIDELHVKPDDIKTLWVEFEGKKHLMGIAYLKEINWFSLTLIDSKELAILKDFTILPMLSILFFVALLAVGLALHTLVLNPLDQLKTSMQHVEHGDYDVAFSRIGSAEIAALAEQFKQMVQHVKETNNALEAKVKERTEGLMQSEKKLNTILDTVEAFIYIKDEQYRYVYANQKTCEYFHKSLDEIIGQTDSAFFDAYTAEKIHKMDQEVIQLGRKISREESNTNHNQVTRVFLSTKIPLLRDDGSIYALCGISTDITERKKQKRLLEHLHFMIHSRNCPIEDSLMSGWNVLLGLCRRSHKYGALIIVDLDNFKPLNDFCGHQAGDALLVEVAQRLRHCVRETDTVARFGGDEFIVALGELDENSIVAYQEAYKIAFKILVQLGNPYVITVTSDDEQMQTIEHRCTASIGVTLFGHEKQNKDQIFNEADKAMFEAKEKGRNRIEFYEEYNV